MQDNTALDTTAEFEEADGQFLSFTLGSEDYGVDILRVQEIRGWQSVRSLPEAAEYVKGILDLRGVIVPIVDLRIRFGVEDVVYSETTVVIVMGIKSKDSAYLVGAVVDAVSDVLDVSGEEIKPAPSIGSAIGKKYLRGMVSLDRGMVILLDIDKLFSAQEQIELEQIQAG